MNVDPQTTDMCSRELNVPLSVSDTLDREKLSYINIFIWIIFYSKLMLILFQNKTNTYLRT